MQSRLLMSPCNLNSIKRLPGYYWKNHYLHGISNSPSPVTMSPSSKLCLAFKTDCNKSLNFFTPLRKAVFNFLLFFAMFFSTLRSDDGGGRWKASNPEKNHRMLSANVCTVPSLDLIWSWKTWKYVKIMREQKDEILWRKEDFMLHHLLPCQITSNLSFMWRHTSHRVTTKT